MLIRHGPSSHPSGSEWIRSEGVNRWREAYDRAGIAARAIPPQSLIDAASACDVLVSSDLPRALDSMKRVAPGREIRESALFREAALPVPQLPVRMPLHAWDKVITVQWGPDDPHGKGHSQRPGTGGRGDELAPGFGPVRGDGCSCNARCISSASCPELHACRVPGQAAAAPVRQLECMDRRRQTMKAPPNEAVKLTRPASGHAQQRGPRSLPPGRYVAAASRLFTATSQDRTLKVREECGMQPCLCFGNNENCFRCYGTGIVRTRAESNRLRLSDALSPRSALARITRRRARKRKRCPESSKPFVTVAAHKAGKHPHLPANVQRDTGAGMPVDVSGERSADSTVQVARSEAQPASVHGRSTCPICRAGIVKYDAHMRNQHGNELLICNGCGSKVAIRNISRHITRCSRRLLKRGSSTAAERSVGGAGAKQLRAGGRTPEHAYDSALALGGDSLDATRDYAHFAREHGRFGSHASHDDFGDAATP